MSFMARQVCEDKSRDMVSSSAGFCYSDGNPAIHIPGFVSDPDMFNLTTGIDMIAFSKNLHHTDTNALKSPHHLPPSSSKTTNFYHSGISEASTDNLFVGAQDSASWPDNRLLVDDSSLRCVFPCEGNERPSQGLSLSLSSTNPLSIGLQSFELRHIQHQQDFVSSASRDKLLGKSVNINVHEDANIVYEGHFMLKHSKYLVAAQELLNEFCSLGTKQSDIAKQRSQKNKQWEDDNGSGSSKKHSIGSLEFVELQKRKTKLLSMLEEVDRRYRHYCNQMKAVVSSFEAVAGNGAAAVYSALALKAMSRHFRCLKDGVMGQIEATRKGMGEKDPVAPGTTRGETPKLRIIDQALRQQRAFQQMSIMETHPWRPQRGLPERSVSVLRAWLFEHFLHPYPSDVDKHILARQTGLSRSQVSNWFINARVRLWKPMVEEMYLEEVKEHENNMGSSDGATDPDDNRRNVENLPARRVEDEKPTQERLGRIESECVSSIINNPDHKNDSDTLQEECLGLGRVTETFGSGDQLDFSSYTHHSAAMVSYSGGVSLTLGLQQHGGGLFYPRDQIEDCQPVQYSLLDGEAQNLPYRNLMGAQLLHDLV